ncbi:hypothetical protein [Janthinobacterium sp. RA13]|uniref:hypothetical protein n=1 Tax=Janthinobacterium sp. RA13 TaxID=1502762 RepID=UPI00056CDE5B|nr:hypothetical protein [Janthinobacterium sp. RA13]
MRLLLASLLRFISRHVLQFLLFIAILAVGHALLEQARQFQDGQARLGMLRDAASQAGTHQTTLSGETQARVEALRRASDQAIAARIAHIDVALHALRQAATPWSFTLALPTGKDLGNAVARQAEQHIRIELLLQERAYLQSLRIALGNESARQALPRLHDEHRQAYQALSGNLARQQELTQAHPLQARLPGTAPHAAMAALQAEEARLREANALAYQRYIAQRQRLAAASADDMAPFQVDQARIEARLHDLVHAMASMEGQLHDNWWRALRELFARYGPTAALLVLSAMLLPVAIKAFFYFVLAPVAARLPPLSIARTLQLNAASLPLPPQGESRISAVSQGLLLQPGQRMLIHPEYLQSSPVSTCKRTQWLLDWRFPFTSLAAGMVALTRLKSSEPASVTISASDDPLLEVAIVHLPAGSALVFQPRGLVGLICDADQPLAISSHWRLGSLHAWLTLQLRFIVFRGPVTLIVRGCRGVRLERAGQGRSISQSATLGFSTDVLYSTLRSETFIPYLRGQQALLNDRFDGDNGVYLYEETPRHGKQPGKVGSWFEGFTDAILKIFGI